MLLLYVFFLLFLEIIGEVFYCIMKTGYGVLSYENRVTRIKSFQSLINRVLCNLTKYCAFYLDIVYELNKYR